MAGQHVIRAECEWLKRGGMAAEVVPAQIERAAAGENRDAGLRRRAGVKVGICGSGRLLRSGLVSVLLG